MLAGGLGMMGTVPPVLQCRPKEPGSTELLRHGKDGAVLPVLLPGAAERLRGPPSLPKSVFQGLGLHKRGALAFTASAREEESLLPLPAGAEIPDMCSLLWA